MMAFAASAQTTAEWWIEALNRSLGDRYGMNISVAMAESESLNGYFMVDGDSYYKIAYPTHNHVRATAQYKLLLSMEEQYPVMQQTIRELL